MTDKLENLSPYMLGLLRIVTALLFLEHGLQKYFHLPPGGHMMGPIEIFSLPGIAGAIELIGGTLVTLGAGTRICAFIMSGEMAVAYWMVHFGGAIGKEGGMFPIVNGGDAAILFCFIFLYLVFAGSGAWSLDRRLGIR